MKSPTHFFDPVQERFYSQKLSGSPLAQENNSAELRQLFYRLNQPRAAYQVMPQAYDFIKQQLAQAQQNNKTEIIQDYSVDKLSSLQAATVTPLARSLWTQDNLHAWLKQTTAIMLTQPRWLQTISPAAASQTLPSMQLMSLYLQLTRKDPQGADLQQSYQAMLLAAGVEIPRLHRCGFSLQPELSLGVLDFATLQLAFARFPRVFLPEILGFTLAYSQMPTIIEVCFPQQQRPSPFFQQRKERLQQQIIPLLQCITTYLDLFPQYRQGLWQRVQQGFWLYQLQMQRNRTQLSETLKKSPTQHAFAKLLQQKAMAAMGHHQNVQLQGRALDQWFAELPGNTPEFLHALIQSGYVDKKTPANSQLLKLFAFKGPMFGVLDQSEQDTLLSWLQSSLGMSAVDTVKAPVAEFRQLPETRVEQKKSAKLSNKELYYYLLNVDLFPEVLPVAKVKVRKHLRACTFFNSLPFKHYSHQQFDAYIKNIYQHEVNTYKPLQGEPKISKEAYIWGLEQIAPLILIDGCWIQNSLALQDSHPEISEILFDIYADELGNGLLEQNHPFIFQQLLDSLSIHIPPAYSREFSEHSGFIHSAFDLPVYMLGLSCFSVEFLPELLGLNMAIELSGLGKNYLCLVDDWKYWGIDPHIASIHISIDNYAGGHTFLAKKTIQIYMDELLQRTGNIGLLDKHWRRIYSGYASLRFVGGRFKYGLPVWYLRHKYKKYRR